MQAYLFSIKKFVGLDLKEKKVVKKTLFSFFKLLFLAKKQIKTECKREKEMVAVTM